MEPRERFERLYRDHASLIRRYAARRGDRAEADDVVADVFLAVWRRLDEVPTEPVGWLLGIARGVMSNQRRAEDRHAALIVRLAHEQTARADGAQSESEVGLVNALGTLSAGDQELLLLTAWEQLSNAQIAQVLDLPRGTVAVRLHRARRRMRQALAVDAHRRPATPNSPTEVEMS